MRKILFALVTVVVVVLWIMTFAGHNHMNNTVTDLGIGAVLQVSDFETCLLPNGSRAYEWHFGGADRSRRNQLTPVFDGRGRRILRKSSGIPAGTMMLRKVVEHHEDPTLEGFKYGTYVNHWEGLVIDYNGPIRPQATIHPCGPAR